MTAMAHLPASRERSDTSTSYCEKDSMRDGLLFYKGRPALYFPATEIRDAQQGQFFPVKLAFALGMAKMLTGIVTITFGAVAIVLDASLARLGSGLWAGALSSFAGGLGLLASRKPSSALHLISFLCVSITCVATTGLMVVFTTVGLMGDINAPNGYYVDSDGNRINFLGEVNVRAPATAVNVVLLVLAGVDILLSLACCIISGREACQCYSSGFAQSDSLFTGPDSQVRKDRLILWLGQQNSLPTLSVHNRRSKANLKDISIDSSASEATVPTYLSSDTCSSGTKKFVAAIHTPSKSKNEVNDHYYQIDKQLSEEFIERSKRTSEN